MKVEIEKVFPMPCNATTAWTFLQNIESVGNCMPGAKITERIDENNYRGTVSIKVGPASMSFKGTIEVKQVDEANRMLRLIGKGSDTTGTSGASMDLEATVKATGDTCELVGKSEVAMTGKAAAFGGRMMNTVAEQILKQFAANFALQVAALQSEQVAPVPVDTSLNGLALGWAIVRDWFRGLFSAKSA
ncbi:SRPBCC family protein [Actimicrobium antarcticum]|uniref:Carbon monoxide dehydrogenase n=1 Tax=Actimicrobium antarcticum TaxID=1051899 RepID=A0ABP7T855_9BURK